MHRNEKEAVFAPVEHDLLAGLLVDDGPRGAFAKRQTEKPAHDSRQEKADGKRPLVGIVITFSPPRVEGQVEDERESKDDDEYKKAEATPDDHIVRCC